MIFEFRINGDSGIANFAKLWFKNDDCEDRNFEIFQNHNFSQLGLKGRIATRSKKPKNSQKSGAPHFGKNITTFAKADLPSDDEEDVEFNISSDKHEDEEEEDEDEDEEEDFSEVDDIPVLQDEDTQTSIRSEDSVQIIARKTRSKLGLRISNIYIGNITWKHLKLSR